MIVEHTEKKAKHCHRFKKKKEIWSVIIYRSHNNIQNTKTSDTAINTLIIVKKTKQQQAQISTKTLFIIKKTL